MNLNLKKLKIQIKSNCLYLCMVALCFIIIFCFSYYNIDPDFGWHLRSGKFILENWIPKTDIFSYTAANFNWINHEWLNDVFLASLFGMGGYLLVAIAYSSIWISALVLAQRLKLKFVLLLSTIALMPFLGIRPVAWSVFFIALLERIHDKSNKKLYFLIPFIFILWANLHGSFVFGLIMLAAWQFFSKKKLPWLILAFSFIAVFINPYGWKIFIEIFSTVLDSKIHSRIGEWMPIMLPMVSVIYFVIFTAMHFTFSKKPWKSLLSIPGIAFAMTMSSVRHFPIFAVTSIRYFENYQVELRKKVNLKNLNNSATFIVSTMLGCFILFTGFFGIQLFNSIVNYNNKPFEIVDYIKKNPCNQNIFNSYDLGGFLIWQLPENKYFIDGRMPSWKEGSTDYFENYKKILSNDEYRAEEFNKYNINCVIVGDSDLELIKSRSTPFIDKLTSEGWQQALKNKGYYLMIKNN